MLLLRLAPAALLAVLVVVRVFVPSFLETPIVKSVPWLGWLTWFLALFLVLGYIAAWALTPIVVKLLNRVARRWFLPLSLLLVGVVGGLWLIDVTYGHTLAQWFGWPELGLLDKFTAAIFGGS